MLEQIKARFLDSDVLSRLEGNELAALFRADVGWLLAHVEGVRRGYEAYHFYVCASDLELDQAGMTRGDALVRAVEADIDLASL